MNTTNNVRLSSAFSLLFFRCRALLCPVPYCGRNAGSMFCPALARLLCFLLTQCFTALLCHPGKFVATRLVWWSCATKSALILNGSGRQPESSKCVAVAVVVIF